MADIFNNFKTTEVTEAKTNADANTEAKAENVTEAESKTEAVTETKTQKTKIPEEEVHDMKWAVKHIRSDKFKLDLLDRIMWSGSKPRKAYAFTIDKKERLFAVVLFTNMAGPALIVHELCAKIELDFDSKSESSILKTHVRQMKMTLRKTSLSGRDVIICQVDE